MPTLDEALGAVHDAVLRRVGQSDARIAFAFEFGTPLPRAALAGPDGAAPSPARARELMSLLADAVPDLSSGFFRRSGRTVSGQYQLLAESARPLPATPADTFATIKAGALRRLDAKLGSVEGPGAFLPVTATPSTWYDAAATEGWQRLHVQSEQVVAAAPRFGAALRQWRSPAVGLARRAGGPGLAPLAGAVDVPVVPSLRPASNYASTPTSGATFDVDVVQRSHRVPVLLECYAPWAPAVDAVRPQIQAALQAAASPAAWVGFDMSQDDSMDKLVHGMPYLLAFMNGQAVEGYAPRVDQPDQLRDFIARLGPSFLPTGTDRMVVDFDMNVVLLDRPWLAQDLLGTPGWYVPGLQQGVFSLGQAASGPGNLAAMPIACVLARDLRISAQWTTADRTALDNAADLGPFSLAGHQFDGHSGTITVAGMQAIGWVCGVVPPLPPSGDPAA